VLVIKINNITFGVNGVNSQMVNKMERGKKNHVISPATIRQDQQRCSIGFAVPKILGGLLKIVSKQRGQKKIVYSQREQVVRCRFY
jgi:hypothetical protein